MSNIDKYSNYLKDTNTEEVTDIQIDDSEKITKDVENQDENNLEDTEVKISEDTESAEDLETEYQVNQEFITFKNKCANYAADKKTSILCTFITLGFYVANVFASGNLFSAWWFWLLSNIALAYAFALFKCAKDVEIGEIYRKYSKRLAINIVCILIFGSIFIICV